MTKYLLMVMFFVCGFVQAHPLGIFSINRYTRIELVGDKVRLIYVLDVAEIPTTQEWSKIDQNGDGTVDEQERQQYSDQKIAELTQGFQLSIDRQRLTPTLVNYSLLFPEGQGGLKTIRLEPVFEAEIPRHSGIRNLHFMDENFRDRMGWKEVCVRSICGETIQATTVPQTDITDELRNYPADRLTNPLNVSEASIQYLPGTAKPTASSFAQSVVEKTKDGFAELISAKEISPSVMVISLLIAMMLGAGHALTPGHGKTIVAAYLVGQRGTAKHAAFLGLTVTATHTIGVFAMGLIALFASQYVLPENLFPWLGSLSGLIVLFIGLSLLLKRIRYARGMLTHTHDGHTHSHDHHEPSHEHSHGGHTHSHLPSGADGAPVTWKSLLALGVSGGLLPCPSAIVVLLSAVALGRIGFGLLLIIAFSIGLAGVLTGIGLLMVYARKFFERFSISGPLARWLPVMSAFIVTIAGAIITVQAVGQTGIRFDGSFLSNSLSLQSMFSAGALSILGLGFILGLKHALDADHLVAVSTIVSERKGFWSSSLVGAFWGLGHTASLLVVGLIVIAFNVQIPEKIAQGMEFTVALMLIVLGTNVLRKLRRGATMHFHIHKHQHHIHMHPHLHESVDLHRHGDRVVHHHHVKIGKKPFLVGMVHGMAGSAALMLLVLATISSRPLALLYIAIFGIGSVGGMFLMSMLIGLPFSFTSNHERLNNIVRMSAGIISLCFGLFYAWQVGIVDRLFL